MGKKKKMVQYSLRLRVGIHIGELQVSPDFVEQLSHSSKLHLQKSAETPIFSGTQVSRYKFVPQISTIWY